MDKNFNPNLISISNGNYFALPYSVQDSKLVLISVPWDVTTSYKAGSSKAPDKILEASEQIDLYDIDFGDIYEMGIGTLPFNDEILELNKTMRSNAESVISFLADGGDLSCSTLARSSIVRKLKRVNESCEFVNTYVFDSVISHINDNKLIGLIGGDHSTPYGLIKALATKHNSFGILHIDAHADLRVAFEDFTFSHASIMYNVINDIPEVNALVQVGIRDFCSDELQIINSNDKITTFFDNELKRRDFCGDRWTDIVDEIISKLPQKVYVSFDIDGLESSNCPNTGTPVPGGLTYPQATYLITKLAGSGKQIIGFDVNEVGYSDNSDWDANVGSRLIYKLCCATLFNNSALSEVY